MLLVADIERDFDACLSGLQKRGLKNADELLQSALKQDKERKKLQGELDKLLHESNGLSKEIGQLYQQGKKEEADTAKARTSKIKEESKALNETLSQVSKSLLDALYALPNVPHESVPDGQSDEDNEIIKTVDDTIPQLSKSKKPHWELIEEYDIVDFETGNKVSGSGFPFYKGKGAKLVRGMINYFLDEADKAGYSEVQAPIVINEASGLGTGQLPDKEGQMYHIEANDLYLIPTAEVPLTNMYRDTIIKTDELPIKITGHTPCFRREAGSWGSHVRGLNRLHQFDKVEIIQVVAPSKSYEILDEMVSHVERLVQSLGLPYRILKLCGGDLGFTAALTYDFEVYSAAQEKWLEVSSVSNFETYQANRLKLRIKGKDAKKELAHTLNGSALAVPRILAALLENGQEADHIKIPEILHTYCGFGEIRKK